MRRFCLHTPSSGYHCYKLANYLMNKNISNSNDMYIVKKVFNYFLQKDLLLNKSYLVKSEVNRTNDFTSKHCSIYIKFTSMIQFIRVQNNEGWMYMQQKQPSKISGLKEKSKWPYIDPVYNTAKLKPHVTKSFILLDKHYK